MVDNLGDTGGEETRGVWEIQSMFTPFQVYLSVLLLLCVGVAVRTLSIVHVKDGREDRVFYLIQQSIYDFFLSYHVFIPCPAQ